ncbi:T9SS type B sorting domain-containing protein [Arundinibacter roseus]|uniref:T9SS type B sorting domain-containing protein n=1 Tax=Arundinibacter roseus TaxID=2070510 RepID=A0A4V2X9H4_9BACT|nr:gliding motility-associated C-terminal domain-containing protein [Arundinibacter roseus]TDB63735.1 T9SS type B sorting domain-containing protein [Arundinibacter roseus]
MWHCRLVRVFLMSCLLGWSLPGHTQDLCLTGSGGGFSINGAGGTAAIEGCAPFTVTVESTVTGANNIAYNFDYKGEPNPVTTTSRSFNFSKPGRYRILQVGSSGATGITACREIIVRDRTPPKATATACTGGRVLLTIADDSISRQYDQFEIQWNDGSGVEYINKGNALTAEHLYTGTGARIITVKGAYFSGDCNGSNPITLPVQVRRDNMATIGITEVVARADGTVGLSYSGLQLIESEVWAQSGSQPYAALGIKSTQGGPQQLTLSSLNPEQVHCLKMRSTDACSTSVDSDEICTMLVKGIAENERNVITWNQYPNSQNFLQYQVLRNGIIVQSFTSTTQTSYIDLNVECGISYRYQVIAFTQTARSVSAPLEVTAKSDLKPSVIEQALVSVEQNGSVSLVAFPPLQGTTPTYKMIFERAENGTNGFQEVGVTENTNRYTDITAATSVRSYCYRVLYENACGNRSDPSPPICTIFLQNSGTTIRWTDESPFTDDLTSFLVIKLNPGSNDTETDVGLNTTFDPQFDDPDTQEFNYQIRTRSANGAFLSYSNVILFRREANLFLPDAFSPNGDGINDFFGVKGVFFDSFQMFIYNRWGQVVFQTGDTAEGWDGRTQGNPAQEGQYVYKVIIRDNTGKDYIKTGTVLLLR